MPRTFDLQVNVPTSKIQRLHGPKGIRNLDIVVRGDATLDEECSSADLLGEVLLDLASSLVPFPVRGQHVEMLEDVDVGTLPKLRCLLLCSIFHVFLQAFHFAIGLGKSDAAAAFVTQLPPT